MRSMPMPPLHLRLRRRLIPILLLLLLLLLRDDHDHGGANAFAPSSSTTSTSSTSRARITQQPSYFLEIYAGRSISSCHNSIPRRRMMMLSKMSSNENNNNSNNMNNEENTDNNIDDDESSSSASSSALSRQEEAVAKKPNPYLSAIATPPPSDLISAFANTASPRAKNAARATIAGLMGGLTSNMMNGQKGYEDGLGGMAGSADNGSGVGGVGSASRGRGGGVMDAQSRGGDANASNVGFTSKIVATGARLANLMFQLQMTGYMLRNAEYRLELGRSLGASSESSGSTRSSSGRMLPSQLLLELDAEKEEQRRGRIVKGTKIKVRYGGVGGASGASSDGGEEETTTEEDDDNVTGKDEDDAEKESVSSPFMGLEVEVDAKAYVSELRGEIKRLRDAIESTRREKEEKVEEDLLMYIRSLPPQELQQLTGTMSPEVLEAMKGLVSAVLAGIGEESDDDDAEDSRGFGRGSGKVVGAASVTGPGVEDEERPIGKGSGIGPNTVTEQSGEALARLCMWQLVVGYNLREMEVREKLRASMEDSSTTTLGDDGSDLNNDDIMFGPGVLE